MTGRRVKKAIISWPSTVAMALWLSLFSQTDMAATLHGWVFPVVSPIQVTRVEPVTINGVEGSRIEGYAHLARYSCDYIDVKWELVGESRSVAVTAFFSDPATVRERGRQEWQALMVGVPPHKLDQTRGVVRHECGKFPVLSPFFLPDESIVPTDAGATAICADGAYTTSTGPGTCSGHGGVQEWL